MNKFHLLLAASLIAAPAPADAAGEAGIVRVSHADLDLRSPEGKAALDRRVRSAVRTACAPASDADLMGKKAARRCRTDAFKAAAEVRLTPDARRGGAVLLASER